MAIAYSKAESSSSFLKLGLWVWFDYELLLTILAGSNFGIHYAL